MSLGAHAPSSCLRWTGTELARCSGDMRNAVWLIPSGPVMPSAIATSSVLPPAASTTLPSQSVPIPYSYVVPGSATSGAVKHALRPDRTFGVPVAASYLTMSGFQNP